MALFFALFLFTGYAGGAVRHTADNRIMLQLAPALLFFAMVIWLHVRGLACESMEEQANSDA
ncbi:hypothetical protein F2Q65_06885 [Thiohalocapsa marina]|uniref:Uncharacterized protein n=1 Tax=Thiohalocapsa marina TaxID=424902 RepID=A0A5M8FMV5_9GAMM|nr:hypothetical protein [Thiohalocapsa marina]KAA6186077.1 hypothetical protein F2Q65_06885 [Thiohalocapsa marina]